MTLLSFRPAAPLVLLLFLLLSACNRIPHHADYIPKEALFVGTVNVQKLTRKMVWNAITGSTLFEEMQEKVRSEKSREAMKDFSSVGLQANSTVYFFYTGSLRKEGNICFLLGMDDQKAFERFIKGNLPGALIREEKGYRSAQLEQAVFAAWNAEAAMFFPMRNALPDSVLPAEGIGSQINSLATIQAFVQNAFSLSKENAVTALPHFRDLHKAGHDISFWANYEEIFRQSPDLNAPEVQAFVKADYFRDAALATGVDFEDGAAEMVMDYYMSKELAALYGKHSGTDVEEQLLRQIPSGNIAMLAAYHVKPGMLTDFLAEFKLDGLANLGLAMMGTSLEKLTSGFAGDYVFAITDLNVKDTVRKIPDTDLELVVEPEMNISMALSVSSKSTVEDLLVKGVREKVLTRQGNAYRLGQGALMLSDQRMIYSSDPALGQKWMAGKNDIRKALPSGAWEEISGEPFCFFVDIPKILQFIPESGMDSSGRALLRETSALFTYLEMHGGTLKKQANHMEGHLYFSNREENALVQLLNLAMKVKQESEPKVPRRDSVVAMR